MSGHSTKFGIDSSVMEQILKSYPGDVMIVDKGYSIVYTNIDRQNDPRHADNIIGEKCYHHCRYLQPGSTECYAKKVFATGKPAKGLHYQLKTGKWLEINGIPIRNQEDEIMLVAEFVTDVSDYKKLDPQSPVYDKEHGVERRVLSLSQDLEGEWTWNPRNNEMRFSDEFINMLGYNADNIKESFASFSQLIHPKDFGQVLKELQSLSKKKSEQFSMDYRIKYADGHYRWVHGEAKPLLDRDGDLLEIKGTQKDIHEMMELDQQTQFPKMRDEATTLYSRIYFEDTLNRLNTERMHPITLFFVETESESMTEYKTRSTAHLMQCIFRKEDVIARWDDKTFAIVLPNTGAPVTEAILNRICEASNVQGIPLYEKELNIGYATKISMEDDLEAVFIAAREQLEQSRKEKKEKH